MALSKDAKAEIIAEYARAEGDTGSTEVQVALLTHAHQRTHRAPQDSTRRTTTPAVVFSSSSVSAVAFSTT